MPYIRIRNLHNHNALFFSHPLAIKGKNICLASFRSDLLALMFYRLKWSSMKAIEEAVASKSPDALFELERKKGWFGKIFQPIIRKRIEDVVANGYSEFGERWKTLDQSVLPSGNDDREYIDFWMITFVRFVFMDFQQDLERLLAMDREELRSLKSWEANKHLRFNRKLYVLDEMLRIIKRGV